MAENVQYWDVCVLQHIADDIARESFLTYTSKNCVRFPRYDIKIVLSSLMKKMYTKIKEESSTGLHHSRSAWDGENYNPLLVVSPVKG